MDAAFSFSVDPARNLVSATLSGFFTVEDVTRFIVARDAAHLRLRCPANQHLTMVDVREMRIQSQDSVRAFQRMLGDPRAKGRAIAFVVSQSLARQQLQRAAAGRHAGYFTCLKDAEHWLTHEALEQIDASDDLGPTASVRKSSRSF